MNFVILCSIIFGIYAMTALHKSTYAFIPFCIISIYNIFFYRPTQKDWDMGGFSKMVVDTDKNLITFDDKVKLRMDTVEKVRIELEERPTMVWLLGLGMQYTHLINGELVFKLESGRKTVINVQFKAQALKILKLMHEMQKPCRILNEEFIEEGVPSSMYFLLGAILIIGMIALSLMDFIRHLLSI